MLLMQPIASAMLESVDLALLSVVPAYGFRRADRLLINLDISEDERVWRFKIYGRLFLYNLPLT